MFEPVGVLLDECRVEDGAGLLLFSFQQFFHQAFEQGYVAIDFDGQK